MDSIDIDIDEDLITGRGATGERTQVTAMPYDLKARYTGRASALGPLMEAVERARKTRSISFLVLVGEPGMGKSSTVVELARTLEKSAPDTRCLVGAADGSGVLYAPFARLLSARFGITPSEPLVDSREKIIAGVGEVMPAARVTETAHLVAHLMRIPFPDSPIIGPLAESPQHLEARTFLALRRFVAADAAAGPLVLCFENLEQAETETINLLHYLVAGLQGSPVVILGTARESIYDRHPSFGDVDVTPTRIDLGPLTDAEAEGLLRELCRPLERVPDSLVKHAVRVGRSPRALFELMRFLLESNIIVRAGGASWRVDEAALDEAALPEDHEELVAERVRILPDAERDVLEMASVIGETFWMDGVVALIRVRDDRSPDPDGPTLAEIAAAGDQTRSSAAAAMVRLIENEWVVPVPVSSVPGEHEYRFAYPYLWSNVYDSIQGDARRTYHRVVAQYLELRPQGRAAMAQEETARHLELAGDAAGAAARYRRAADFARKSFFNDRAIRLYSQALACLGEADLAARIHLWHDLGSVYELKGDYEAALGGFERMLRLAWVCASRTKAAVAFNKMGRVWRRKGDLKLALEYLERGLELFEQSADLRGIGGSFDDIGSVLYLLGRYDEAYEKVTVGLARRGHGGDKRSIAHSLSNLGNIQKDRGRTEDALTCHQEALEIRRAVGDRAGAITSLNNLAVLAYERGDREDARRGWEQALTEAEEIGALPLQALTLGNLGELALEEDRTEEARRRLEEALEIAQEIDDRQLQVEALRNLALLEHAGGDGPRSRQLAQRAYQVASTAGLRDNEGRALLTLGQVFTGTSMMDDERTVERPRHGEAPIADAYFARGVELLRQIGNQSELARGLDRYGRYKIEQGDTPGGVALLREAQGLYGRLGMREATEVERLLGAV
ncbi:MAG TPA: tetratricopeptide repeat protein [Kofleriaceae bacterium]|nr:tetratricopeptide repeat protein [Kofleriaceae bacterium]